MPISHNQLKRKRVHFDECPFPLQSMLNDYNPKFSNRVPTPYKVTVGYPFKKARYESEESHTNIYSDNRNRKEARNEYVEWKVLKVKSSKIPRETMSESGKRETDRIAGYAIARIPDSLSTPKLIPINVDYRQICIDEYTKPQKLHEQPTYFHSTLKRSPIQRAPSIQAPSYLKSLMSQLKSKRIIEGTPPKPPTPTNRLAFRFPNVENMLRQRKEIKMEPLEETPQKENTTNMGLCHDFTHSQRGCSQGAFCNYIHDEEIRRLNMLKRFGYCLERGVTKPRNQQGDSYSLGLQLKLQRSTLYPLKHPVYKTTQKDGSVLGKTTAYTKLALIQNNQNNTQIGYLNLEL